MPMVWVVLANAVHQDWEMEHVDIKSADEHAWLLPSEITLIALIYSSFNLI